MAELTTAIATAITAGVVLFEAVRRLRRDRRQDHLLKAAEVRALIHSDDIDEPYIEIINEGPGRASDIKAELSGIVLCWHPAPGDRGAWRLAWDHADWGAFLHHWHVGGPELSAGRV
jgi:hypothetical protein